MCGLFNLLVLFSFGLHHLSHAPGPSYVCGGHVLLSLVVSHFLSLSFSLFSLLSHGQSLSFYLFSSPLPFYNKGLKL